jgi:HK97 gp10 family phage protein
MRFELRGLRDVQVSVSRWQAKKITNMRALVKKTANNIRRNARRKVPVKTGRLRKSIQVKYGDQRMTAYVRAVAPHSHLVEFGSAVTGASPHPFMQPAYDGQKSKYERELTRILGEV